MCVFVFCFLIVFFFDRMHNNHTHISNRSKTHRKLFISIHRAFTCDTKSKNCSVSITKPDANSFTPPKDLCNHHCSGCIGYTNPPSADLPSVDHKITGKKANTQNKKPLLKSIILSTNKSAVAPFKLKRGNHIKQEIDEDITCDSNSIGLLDSIVTVECSIPKIPQPNTHTEMQFSDTKKTKQINSYFKSNDFVPHNARSYSPPLPVSQRVLTSVVSNDSHHMGNSDSRQSRSSRDAKSSKKRKKRRRSYSKNESRSRSR